MQWWAECASAGCGVSLAFERDGGDEAHSALVRLHQPSTRHELGSMPTPLVVTLSGPLSTQRWQRLRLAILARDGHLCQMRGPHCKGTATTVDHIVERTNGGDIWDPTNLRAACVPCNCGRKVGEPHSRTW